MTLNRKYWNILIAVIYLFTAAYCIYILDTLTPFIA